MSFGCKPKPMKALLTAMTVLMASMTISAQRCETGKLDPVIAQALGNTVTDLPSSPNTSVEQIRDLRIPTLPFPATDLKVIKVTRDSIPLHIYNRHHQTDLPIIIGYHPGGFVTPMLPFMQYEYWRKAKMYDAIVIAVDYRVAPEHPFPAAVNDAYNAFRYIVDHGTELGGDTSRIVLLGESAGGNLATVVSRKATEDGMANKIQLQILNCPSTDDPRNASRHPSYQKYASGYFQTKAFCEYYIRVYAPNQPPNNPDIAPLHANNLEGMPPVLMITAEFDVMRDEAYEYVEKLRSAGVRVSHVCFPGQIHCLVGLPDDAPQRKELDELINSELD